MELLGKWIVGGMLAGYSLEDMRKNKITTGCLIPLALLGMGLQLYKRGLSWESLVLGMGVGAGLLLLSWVSRGNIGAGDGLLLIVTGIYLGGFGNLELLLAGLGFAAVFSLVILVLGKGNRKREIPFVPFLFLGYLAMLVEEML